MRWILPLVVIGLVGCSEQSFSGRWSGQVDGNPLVMDVAPSGTWTAEQGDADAAAEAFSGTWVMRPDGKAVFTERGAAEHPAEGELIGENRLILRSADTETQFSRVRSK